VWQILTGTVPEYKYRVASGMSPVAPGYYMTPADAEDEKRSLSKK
jgi:hypothetical protein